MSKEDAKRLVSTVSAIDVQSIPLGLRLNQWTEDGFHGSEHKSTSEWLPEIPMEPSDQGSARAAWDQIQNSYIDFPSDEKLWPLLDGVINLTGSRFSSGGVSERIAKQRYLSVLQFQHMLRWGSTKMPDLSKTKNTDRFSIWETAQIVDVMGRGCAEVGTDDEPYPCWKYSKSFYKKMGTDRDFLLKDILKIRLPWLIAGWLLDPALQYTEGGDAQILHLHDALERHQETNGDANQYNQLPIHSLYFSFIRMVKATKCWNSVGNDIWQWVDQTMPHLNRLLDVRRSVPIDIAHKDATLKAISLIHRVILLQISEAQTNESTACPRPAGLANDRLNEAVSKMEAWPK